MASHRLDMQADQLAAVLSQLANMRAWVFRQDPKVFTAEDWNPRRKAMGTTKPKPKPKPLPPEIREAMWKAAAKQNRG